MRILVFFPFIFLMRPNNVLIVTLMKSPLGENLKSFQNEKPVKLLSVCQEQSFATALENIPLKLVSL